MSNKYIKIIFLAIIVFVTMGSLCNKNKLPNTVTVPTGPTSGFVDSSYTFTSSATDPDADNVAIRFYWGGHDTSVWSGYVVSGNTVSASYAWAYPGTYSVKAQAMDEDCGVSAWSAGHSINIFSRFRKTYGGTNTEFGYSVAQTSDGGYIITGVTYSYGTAGDVYLVKADANGDTSWTKTFGGASADFGFSVRQTSDGGYIITGHTSSYGAGNADVYLIKTDANGTQSWYKTFGGSSGDMAFSVQQTSDGGYIITGVTYSYGTAGDVYLIKTDATGNQVWSKNFGGTNYQTGNSVQQTSDGGYIITGYTEVSSSSYNDVYLVKTDINGNQVWTKTFHALGDDEGFSVQQTSDGGYIIAGVTNSYGAGGYDVYLIKTDANGTPSWYKTFGGTNFDVGYSVKQTTDGGYIITGYTGSYGAGSSDVYLIKTEANGNQSWTKTFGGTNDDEGFSVQQTSNGGYIIAGYTNSYGAGGYDVYLIKTDASGNAK